MTRQSDVMDKAVRDFVQFFDSAGILTYSKQCGTNLRVGVPFDTSSRECGVIVMYSYETPIARVTLSDRDGDGHVAVELSAYYYNYSSTTSRHLTYFLSALREAGVIGWDVFDRRAKRYDVEQRAIDALHANNDNRYNTWFTL